MNKMKMYLDLSQWIEMSENDSSPITIADTIWDSPFQHKDFAPYVVVAFVKNIDRKKIPRFVMEKLAEELVKEHEPKVSWYKKCLNKIL